MSETLSGTVYRVVSNNPDYGTKNFFALPQAVAWQIVLQEVRLDPIIQEQTSTGGYASVTDKVLLAARGNVTDMMLAKARRDRANMHRH
jgi:hypothetical protein